MLVLLTVLWGLAYPFEIMLSLPAAGLASRALIAALFVFALFISPWLHRDSLKSRGLGSPLVLLHLLQQRSLARRLTLAGAIAVAGMLLAAELYRNATGATRFIFGIEPAATINLQRTLGGQAVLLGLCAGLSLVWFTCIVRYDNLWPALRAALTILAVLLRLMLLAGWAVNRSAAFSRPKPWNLARNALGYIFWGAVQQLVFCSYFGTRLRKGLAPAVRPERRAWKRLGVAGLNGLFFSLVHINSWLLVGVTWVLGTCLSWVFMQDRYRNLQALGLVHGVLGTCIVWLFCHAGDTVVIRLRVGPWAMPHGGDRWDAGTLAVVGLLLLGLGAALAVVAHRPAGGRNQS